MCNLANNFILKTISMVIVVIEDEICFIKIMMHSVAANSREVSVISHPRASVS